MTLKYEISKLYHRNKIVKVCMFSYKKFKNNDDEYLEHMIKETIIKMKPLIKDYNKYSHGLCYKCLKENYPDSYNRIIKRREHPTQILELFYR